jgi:hypothetical protein
MMTRKVCSAEYKSDGKVEYVEYEKGISSKKSRRSLFS